MSALLELTLAKVIHACGTVDGRVKLQKIVYLLTRMGYGLPFRDFQVRHYGPFSPRLAAALDFLVEARVVEEEPQNFGGESPRFDYTVSPTCHELLEKYVEVAGPERGPALDKVAPSLAEQDRATLEIAATACFLQREEGLSGKHLKTELRGLKGHLREFPGKLKEAEELLQRLGLPAA